MAESEAQKVFDREVLRMAGQKELLLVLKNMVNDPESSDVVLKCNDGVGINACRWLLARRCVVFRGMLCNGMSETTLTEIQLAKFSSPVILSIVEYLYTGTIESHRPTDWKMGFEVISAAQFFIIPRVESIAQEFLQAEVSRAETISAEMPIIMDMLTVALEFPETWEGKDAMLVKVIDGLDQNWAGEDCAHKLSRRAMEFILASSKCGCHQGDIEESLEEYSAFRNIVLWHFCHVVPIANTVARAAVQNALPGKGSATLYRKMLSMPANIDAYISDESGFAKSCNPTTSLSSLVGMDIGQDSLLDLLHHIDLSCIPTSLLLTVICPLQMIPPQQILKAFILKSLQRRPQYLVSRSDWKHGSCCSTGNEGRMSYNGDGDEKAMAVALIPVPRTSDILEWTFEILEDHLSSIELGFYCVRADKPFDEEVLQHSLWENGLARVLSIKRLAFGRTVDDDPEEDWHWLYEGCSLARQGMDRFVSFRLDVTKRTCQVGLKHSWHHAWVDLPEGHYYPAVGFDYCTSASVQLTLVRGYDICAAQQLRNEGKGDKKRRRE